MSGTFFSCLLYTCETAYYNSNNTIAMFFLQVFGHLDFQLQMLGQEADPCGSVWVLYLNPWNWDGRHAWKWEAAASYLMEYQVPAADVLRKMEDVQLHDDGRISFFVFCFYTFN